MNYIQTDIRIHYLCQVLAKAGRTYVDKKEDDSHTNLYFDAAKNRIETHWINTNQGKVKLVLRITDFCMLWVNEKEESIQIISTVKKLESEVLSQLEKGIFQIGLNPNGFADPMHYQIPEYTFVGQPYQMINRHNLDEWMEWRALGEEACEKVLRILDIESSIRIWPHHFDTGIFVVASEDISIGFGLAMADELIGAPYFYMTGYPNKGDLIFENLPDLGNGTWEITNRFKGAILAISELEESKIALDTYIENAINWFLEQ